MFSWAARAILTTQTSRHSAIHGLSTRRKVLRSRTIAAELRGDVRATSALCEVGVRLMKVLRERAYCRSSSFIHMDYNQPLVGGLSVHSTPARQIDNVLLPGGSTAFFALRGRPAHTVRLEISLFSLVAGRGRNTGIAPRWRGGVKNRNCLT